MEPSQLEFDPFVVSPILFVVIALLVRPPGKVVLFALIGGVAFALLNNLSDVVAYWVGWWYFPFASGRYPPLTSYVPSLLIFGAGMVGLGGWWIRRRFGLRSAIVFLPVFAVLGVLRGVWEWVFNAGSIWVRGPGLVPTLALYFDWLILALVTYIIVFWLDKLVVPGMVTGEHTEARV